MESITVALITVVIPLVASRFTVMRADKRDKEVQELAKSLSMDLVAEVIEDRRKRRIYRDALFKGSRPASALAALYALSALALLTFLLRDHFITSYAEEPSRFLIFLLGACSVIFLGSSYFLDLYPTHRIRRILDLEKRMRTDEEIRKQLHASANEREAALLKVEQGHDLTDHEQKLLIRTDIMVQQLGEISDYINQSLKRNMRERIRFLRKYSSKR